MKDKTDWKERTAEYRKAAVMEIHSRPAGESATDAIARISGKYNGRKLPGGKQLHLSIPTLKRIWTRWKSSRSDAAFLVLHGSRKPAIVPRWALFLLEDHAIRHGLSFGALYERMRSADPSFPWSRAAFYRLFSPAVRQRIAMSARLRRKRSGLDREMEKLSGGTQ